MYNGRDGVVTDSNGLYYMRARYYNPEIKRFINQDVVIGNVNDGRSLNRYAYVYGNPVDSTDPFGLSPEMTVSDIGHTILDVFGMVPVFGEVFDAVNSLWYAAEGDFVNAALSSAAIVPVFGMAATGAKWGSKIFKSLKVSERVAETIKAGIKISKKAVVGADNVISSAKRVVRSKIDNVYQGAKTLSKQKKPGFIRFGQGGSESTSIFSKIKGKFSSKKNIDIDKIYNNPRDDVFTRKPGGYDDESLKYQKRNIAQTGDIYRTPKDVFTVYDLGDGTYMLQNGHHRFKAAQMMRMKSIKVEKILPYNISVKEGVTELERGKIPKLY